ncbi:unnamed protein product, partial [marine sediment metagenome]
MKMQAYANKPGAIILNNDPSPPPKVPKANPKTNVSIAGKSKFINKLAGSLINFNNS